MLRSLVFWYCSSFFCPLDLSGPWCHRRSRKFIFLRYTPSKIEPTGHDGGRNTRNSTTNRILAERDSVFRVLSPARHHFLVDCWVWQVSWLFSFFFVCLWYDRPTLLFGSILETFYWIFLPLFVFCVLLPARHHLLVDCCVWQVSWLFFVLFWLLYCLINFQFVASLLMLSS